MQHRLANSGQSSAPSAVGPPAFVGRERELAALQEALTSPPAVIVMEGEAGIGKSRLVRELLATPAGMGLAALALTCPPFRQPHTLGPIADALRQRIYDVAALRLSPLAGALRPLFPEWAADLPPLPEPAEDPSAARHRVFRALTELLDRAGMRLLVVEDVHLADEATSEFILFLAARGSRQLRLVVTGRPEEMPAGSVLSRLLSDEAAPASRRASALRLELEPLDVTATADLVSSMLAGQPVSGEFAQFVHDRTEGVPLAVEESVRMMGERDDLVRRGGEWVRRRLADIDVPPTIRDSVLERAGRLGAPAQALLRAAAILAEPVSPDILATVSDMPAGRATAGLTAALGSGLLSQGDRQLVSFRHALAARAVYETIPGSERRLLHLAAAHVLEELSPRPVAELARHFREAGKIAKWRRYGEESAERAIAAGDEATAVVLLCDLIGQAGLSGRGAARLLDNLAFATMANPARYAQDLVSALRGAMSAGTMTAGEEGVVRFQIGRIMQMTENYDGARAEVQRAIPFLADDPVTAARAMTMLGWAHDTGSPARVYTRWLRRAAPLAESLEPRDRLRIQVDRMTALLMLGEDEGWTEAARIPAEGADAMQRRNITIGQLNAGDLAIMWGRYDEARRRLSIALDMAEAHQYARYRALLMANLTHLDWAAGNWAGLAERARPLADGPPVRLEAVLVVGLLEAVAGHDGPAEDRFRLVLREWKRRGETAYVMRPATALAWLALRHGQVADALQVTDEPMAVVAGKGIWLWAAELGPARVAALIAAGRSAEAAGLTAAFGRGLRGRDIPSARAGLALCRAMLAEASGEQLRAAGLFGRAADACLAMPRPYDALLARERQAACLLRAGRADASVALARQAAQQLAALGARGDAQRVSEMARRNGAEGKRQSPGRPGYGDQLSPRELDVVRLLVSGGTNAEIAEQLFLSPKTVARHLESAMRKLGVSTRTALAVRLVETGIVSPGAPEAAGTATS